MEREVTAAMQQLGATNVNELVPEMVFFQFHFICVCVVEPIFRSSKSTGSRLWLRCEMCMHDTEIAVRAHDGWLYVSDSESRAGAMQFLVSCSWKLLHLDYGDW